jgi:hypothetical protein
MDALLYLLLACSVGCGLWLRRIHQRLDAKLEAANETERALREQLDAANLRLDAYRPVLDAEAHALRVVRGAESYAQRIRLETDRECSAMRRAVTEHLREADETLSDAEQRAQRIVAAAEQHALETAGEALRTKANAAHLEATLQAMRNTIEGYGDRYVVSTASVLDELADSADFAAPAQALKTARERSRALVKARAAVACDAVDTQRQKAVQQLVREAFDGRVEAILTELAHQNVGTLEQKIRDAAQLVNKAGEAFDHANILPAYVEARVAEVRLGAAVQELLQRERETQRLARERAHEEELAQSEFERARREATEEEESLVAAIRTARRSLSQISGSERTEQQRELQLLTDQLSATREKAKRVQALSRNTKMGTVYVVSNVGSFGEGVFKIGMTRRLSPEDCIAELAQSSVPFPFDVHALIRSDDAAALEKELRRRLAQRRVNKVNTNKDFYRVALNEIRTALEAMGPTSAHWTLTAPCREYRESLALEERALEESWVEEQERSVDTGVRRRDAAAAEPSPDPDNKTIRRITSEYAAVVDSK